jgi:hypothetical protein
MTSKLPLKNKSCSKFVFLTKKFKENKSLMFLKLFFNAMIRNIKIQNIIDIIEIAKSMEPNKCFFKFFYECSFKCFL